MFGGLRVFPMVFGNTMNSHKAFMNQLKSNIKLREVSSGNESDVLMAFVPIVSRAGTDIQAALQHIPERHSYKHIILVVLHHTHDPEHITPDSRHTVHRSDVFAVDCLFHEEQGLLKSRSNHEALKRVIKHLGGEKPLTTNAVDNIQQIARILVQVVCGVFALAVTMFAGLSIILSIFVAIFVFTFTVTTFGRSSYLQQLTRLLVLQAVNNPKQTALMVLLSFFIVYFFWPAKYLHDIQNNQTDKNEVVKKIFQV